MRLYLSSSLCWAYPLPDVIKLAKLFHFDGVEVWAEHVWHYQTSVNSILHAKEEYNIELSLHAASWDLNISAINEGIRKQSIQEIENSMMLAKQLEATNVTIHPGRRTLANQWLDKHEQLLIENLQMLAYKAEQLNVTLSIEQMEAIKKEFITSPKPLNGLLEQLPDSIQTTFDIAHVPLSESPEAYFHQINRINKIHISDATHQIYHVPLGTGLVKLDPILRILRDTDLPVVVEGFESNRSLSMLQQNVNYLDHKNLRRRENVENLSYE
ncbi:sugar phosphate isomerase/epimerase family protein [Aquibacillus kalidii]|uniref:sugar phosphate isomerase/epimerase family protein n=1 Tax=Aquibacillus kalidii TaxID=2762597 RepID=UPI00164681FA|nr:sugar phosphate isomerase/epimerase family protein [Aquibacillus kalidii]